MSNKRFCFVKDEDSHLYLLPLELKDKFEKVCEESYQSDEFDEFENLFSQYRQGSNISSFSFSDPKEIED